MFEIFLKLLRLGVVNKCNNSLKEMSYKPRYYEDTTYCFEIYV